ncbi:unnamed protein product [Phyllotreta striolata]|uniref:Uncharacterized protein n=1 Tax=Phyllotreta striolata TaxID=444603 RepID=A0A9N9TF00_PHYSR|nr:unnamed protein product [Phyllotreta striolata]
MSGYKRVSFYELCRLCASNTQKEKTHIFQEEGKKIQLQNKIQVCLALTVNENDCLPKVVCSKCLRSLETCYDFRQECVRSESMLSTYFKNFRYTEDFKKSGKVYIKDIKSTVNVTSTEPTTTTPTPVTSSTQAAPQNVIINTNRNQQNVEQVPFYTLQLPTIVTNPNIVTKTQKQADSSKITQNQFAYNLNLINTANLSKPKAEIVSNVVVNSNGEVINIAHMGDFETILNQGQALKPKSKFVKRKTEDENVVRIDLTESDNSDYALEANKYDKLPHIKNTYKSEDKSQKQTVIFPISEYNQTFNSNNVVYTQPNLNFVSSNSTVNVMTTTVETSALNVINQNLQETSPPAYTNVISGDIQEPEDCKIDLPKSEILQKTNNSNQKPHVCEVCQRAFKRREHLYQHIKLHTGFRPYICEQCNKAFMRKEHLLRHSTLHSGQKNFTCHICNKSFSRNDNLIKHRKTHNKQASYTCEFCSKQFVMKHYYNAHKLTHDKFVSTVWGLLKT